ncbi:MAG: cation transporter [Desulfobacterales bacterium]|nr:cation transporter [Desulfobacterales bacterium]
MVYSEKDQLRSRLIAISLSFLVGMTLMGVKFYAYRITGSSAILSDALESIINVVASAFALGSILLAAKPPDESHPYGHGKIEYFSAGFEGAMIVFAALGIFKAGFSHLLNPRPLPNLQEGLFILMGTGIINLALGLGLVRVGKRTNSLILTADGKHILTDVYTSGGVLLGLFLVQLTDWYWLDGTIACLIGLNILVTGGNLVRQSFARLMDASEPVLLNALSQLFTEHRKDIWIDIHQLRAWRSGNFVHIDLHLILPRDLTLEESHHEAKELEKIIKDSFNGQAGVLIHMDPCVDKDCPVCSRHLCELRKRESQCQMLWNVDTLIMNGGVGERLQELPKKPGTTGYKVKNLKKT